VWEGGAAPDACPKCGAPKDKFTAIEEADTTKILRSRLTNEIHMEIYALMEKAKELAGKGVQDNLDPACVSVFQKTLEAAKFTQQRIAAELQGHVQRGKWG
jgi:hypothetical protein